MGNVKIVSSSNNWLEQNAVDQLKRISELEGVQYCVGFPDLHVGKTPVGAAIVTEGIIYPHIIGNDIGCAMALYDMQIEKRKLKSEKIIKKLLEVNFSNIETKTSLLYRNTPLLNSFGTIGNGNHFAEIQEVADIYNQQIFEQYFKNKNHVMVLVHSGSRGYGSEILNKFIREYKAQKGLYENDEGFDLYIHMHNDALQYASLSRDVIAERMLEIVKLKGNIKKVIENTHNSLEVWNRNGKINYIHRKGAAEAKEGLVVIPGSRGTKTYIVQVKEGVKDTAYSIAHGAGRKWERGSCKGRLKEKYTKDSIKTTKFQSKIICDNTDLLYEEAPEAYKNIETVIKSLLNEDLIEVIATLKPVITYKM